MEGAIPIIKLHLGCGKSKLPGYVGLDLVPLDGVDVVHDLNLFPWPFADGAVAEVVMDNLLEHLPDTVRAMEEVWRICGDKATVNIYVPYYNSPGASRDPTHLKFFTEESFDYFTPDGATFLSAYNYYSQARFRVVFVRPAQRRWLDALPTKLQWFLAHHFATVHGLSVRLSAIK